MAHVREVPRKAGTAYEVRWLERGKARQRTFTVKRDAERHAARVELARASGETTTALTRAKTTVAEVVHASLEASRPGLKPRTHESYVKLYNQRVLPEFGHVRVAELTRADVQSWITRLSAEGLAPATVQHCFVALRKAIKHALYERLIAYDPCAGVKLPKNHRSDANFEPAILTVAQVESLARALEFHPPYDLLVRFMAFTGLRAGEVAGLRIRDVDLSAGHVSVRQTAQHIDGEWVFGTPKTRRSAREVPLLYAQLSADLKVFKMAHPHSGRADALFWPGRAPGSHALDYDRVWDLASFRRNYFKPALISAGLPSMRVHDLRHTAASLWLEGKFAPHKVGRWMGHVSVVTTDTIYAHLYPSDYKQDIEQFTRFVAER